MTTYRLRSTDLIWAPGVIQFAILHFSTPWAEDRKVALDLIRCWNLPEDVTQKLITGQLPLEIDEVEGTVTIRI